MAMQWPDASADSRTGLKNFFPEVSEGGPIRRIGYRNFFGLIWCLIQANRGCRKHGIKAKYEFTFPLRWM